MSELQPKKSTTVRFFARAPEGALGPARRGAKRRERRQVALARLRVAVTWVQRVSPALAARGLERVFLSPQRHDRPAHELGAFASAQRSHAYYRGQRVPIYSWGRAGLPVVLFVHGWEGRATQVAPYVEPLLQAGFQVVSYDAPGHGEAARSLVSVLDFAAVASQLAGSLAGPVQAAIGHSAGAAALLLAVARSPFTDRIIAIAPPQRPGAFLKRFAGWLSASPATERALQERLYARYGLRFHEIDNRQNVARLRAEGLIIHDRADEDVPFAHGEALAAAWPNAKLMATEGLGHRRILRDADVVRAVVEFVGAPRAVTSLDETIASELFDRDRRASAGG